MGPDLRNPEGMCVKVAPTAAAIRATPTKCQALSMWLLIEPSTRMQQIRNLGIERHITQEGNRNSGSLGPGCLAWAEHGKA